MISQMLVLQVSGVGVVFGVGGSCLQLLSLVCHSCAILGHEESILPLGNMQSSVRLLSHVPGETLIIINHTDGRMCQIGTIDVDCKY